MADTLIAAGHSLEAVMRYTPRQAMALLFAASRRQRHERAELLWLHALAASGDGDAIKKGILKLEQD